MYYHICLLERLSDWYYGKYLIVVVPIERQMLEFDQNKRPKLIFEHCKVSKNITKMFHP